MSFIYKTATAKADTTITINYTYNGYYLSNNKGIIGAPCELIKDEQVRSEVMKQASKLAYNE